MANPVRVSCTAATWTKVLNNKKTGNIYLQTPDNDQVIAMTPVWCQWVDTGEAAPEDLTNAILLDENFITFDRSVESDLYLYPQKITIGVIVDA